MRALVTGGAGFVGKVLRAHLEASGDEVLATDRAAGGPDVTDREAVFSFVAGHPVDVVYHLAAQSHVPASWDDPVGTLRVNVEGTQNMLDAAYAASVARVMLVTSAEVYGSVPMADMPVTEQHPLMPATPYAASKAAADLIGLQAHLGRGQDVIRLRAFNHIGPGQSERFVAAGLAARIAAARRNGEHRIPVGNLSVRRDFTDVRDVVRAYRLVAQLGRAGDCYNVCSGVDHSIGELAEQLLSHARGDLELVPDPALEREVDVPLVRGDSTKLCADTGWRPEIEWADSLRDVMLDAEERLHG